MESTRRPNFSLVPSAPSVMGRCFSVRWTTPVCQWGTDYNSIFFVRLVVDTATEDTSCFRCFQTSPEYFNVLPFYLGCIMWRGGVSVLDVLCLGVAVIPG